MGVQDYSYVQGDVRWGFTLLFLSVFFLILTSLCSEPGADHKFAFLENVPSGINHLFRTLHLLQSRTHRCT